MRKNILFVITVFLVFSCGKGKKDDSLATGTKNLIADSMSMAKDTFKGMKESVLPLKKVNEYFDDFIFNFASDANIQLQRIAFPLAYNNMGVLMEIEMQEWKHDSLFLSDNYYTILLDKEEELDLLGDTALNSAQVEWLYPDDHSVKQYNFEKKEGRWMLEAVNLHSIENKESKKFVEFYYRFAADTVFQLAHINKPLIFVTTDPDDDFAEIETTIDINQWLAFRPELPSKKLSNLNYGQQNDDNSYTKIVQVKGIGNGLTNNFFFHRKNGDWKLYKYEDTSN